MALVLAATAAPAYESGDVANLGLPLVDELGELLATSVLRRGGSVGVNGDVGRTSLLLKLLAGPIASGCWAAVIGIPALGVAAAEEYGIALDHLALVPDPGAAWLDVTAALLDAIDIVVLSPPRSCRPTDARRLLARARQRHSVLVIIDELPNRPAWPESPDLILEATANDWQGLWPGHGTLRNCSISVTASGRRFAGPLRTGQVTHDRVAAQAAR